jgi:hypothetical protein
MLSIHKFGAADPEESGAAEHLLEFAEGSICK